MGTWMSERDINSMPTMRPTSSSRRYVAGDLVLGRYKITGELGQGGMGVVYRCFDEIGGIDVALKALPPELSHNSVEMEEVRENFRLVHGLHHPHIAAATNLEKDSATGDYFLIMECVDGIGLRAWKKQGRGESEPPTPEGSTKALHRVLPIVKQIAAALDYAHSRKVIHRDIKPSNVMVMHDGTVKVLDFGLAAQIHTSMSRVSMVKYGTSGTGPYMAPEQWEGDYQNEATDQYALAVLTYELLAGRCPFETHDVSVMREIVLKSQPKPIPGLDAGTWHVLQKALSKERTERFESCEAFVDALGGEGFEQKVTKRTKKTTKILGMLAFLALLSVVGWGVISSYQSYQSYRFDTRVAVEAVARQSAEQQAEIDSLSASVDAALSGGDLKTAGAKLSELESVAGKGVGVTYRKRYESLAGSRETNKRYAEASVARERAAALDRGQGFGAKLDALEVKWREAEAARTGQQWGQALSAYDAVLSQEAELQAQDAARSQARKAQAASVSARQAAAGENAAVDAKLQWSKAEALDQEGQSAFSKGDFIAAGKSWQEAVRGYDGAKDHALSVQGYVAAKKAYEQALAKAVGGSGGLSTALMNQYGGEDWQTVLKQSRIGKASTNDPVEGRKVYAAALAALPLAVAAAQKGATPRVTIKATVDGRSVAATVRIAGKTEQTPFTVPLQRNRSYETYTTYSSKKRYKATEKRIIADWYGEKTVQITLEEQLEPEAGDELTVDLGGGVKMEMVWIPAGSFMMGSPSNEASRDSDETQHRVTLNRGYWMGKYEVTQEQWAHVMGSNPSSFKGAHNPVEEVSWDDCQAFIKKVNGLTSGAIRLPTEAEWEYACRAGTSTAYSFGNGADDLYRYGNYCERSCTMDFSWKDKDHVDGHDRTAPVGSFRSNAWGLQDMHGNVWEWCQDWHGDYSAGSVTDPAGPSSGSSRVLRGGSWDDEAGRCRSADRVRSDPSNRRYIIGVRVVLFR